MSLFEKVLVHIALFFMIFMPYLIGPFNVIHLFGLGAWILIGVDLYSGTQPRKWPKSLIFLSASYLVAAAYVMLVKFVNQDTGPAFPVIYRFLVVALELVPICIVLSRYLIRKGYSTLGFLKLIVNVAIIQSLIAFLMIGFSGFRSTVFAIMKGNGLDISGQPYFEFRAFGLANGYTFAMPVFMAGAAILAWYLGLCKSKHYLIAVPVILVTALVNARISLLLALVGMLIVLIHVVRQREIRNTKYAVMVLSTTALILFLATSYVIAKYPGIDIWINAAFTETSAISGGESLGTFAVMKEMVHFPRGTDLFFGKGISVFGGQIYGIPGSDIGYVGDLYLGGVLLLLLLYLPVILLALKSSMGDPTRKMLNLVLVVMFLIGNVKGAMVGLKEWFIGFLLIQTFFLLGPPIHEKITWQEPRKNMDG